MRPLVKKTSFDSSKCVSLLELTLKRIKILKSKRLIIAKQSRDDVAKLLEKGQDSNAVARVEYAFREQNIAKAYDLLEQYCHLVLKRISAIKAHEECPSDVKEAVDSLIYAAPRCGDLQELQKLRDLVTIKYGAKYCAVVLELGPGCDVNQQIIEKLSSRPPSLDTRLKLLKEIAVEYKINWNQRAVEASLKSEEASMQEEQSSAVSSSQQVSKRAVSTNVDNAVLHTPDQREPAKLAANNAVPSKPKNTGTPKANQVFDVVQQPTIADVPKSSLDSVDRDGEHQHHDRHKSHAAQNTSPSTTHRNSPKQKDFASASSRKSIAASPINVDKEESHGFPVQQVNLKGEESLAAQGGAARSAMDTGTSRQKDVMDASDKSLQTVAYKQNLHSMHAPDVELKSQQSTRKPSQIFDSHHEGEKFASPKHMRSVERVKPASVVLHQDGLLEKNSPKLSSAADITKPEAFVNPMKVPNVSVRKSFERKSELDEPKGQATSRQNLYEARASSSKPSLHFGRNHQIDVDTTESLAAAKQYLRAHGSYVKTEAGGGEDDYRNTEDSGSKLRTNYGSDTPRAEPYARPRHEGKMDYENTTPTYEQVKETRRIPRAMYPEKHDTSLFDSNSNQGDPYVRPRRDGRMDYKNISPLYEQGKESRRTFVEEEEEDASSRSRQYREMDYKNISLAYDQIKESRETPRAMNQGAEDASLRSRQDRRKDYKNFAPAYEQGKESRRTPRAVADSEFEREFADVQAKMESADRAAEAAKAAIYMARMSSMRSKTKSEVGNVKDSLREADSRTSFKSSSGDARTSIEGVVQGLGPGKDEHESRFHKHLPRHAEMPRANTEVQAVPHQEQEADFIDLRMPHFDNNDTYEFGEEEPPVYAKSRAYTGKKDGGMATNYQGRLPASDGYAYDAPIRPAGEGSMRDGSKQRWKLTADGEFDAEPPLQDYTRVSQDDQYPAIVHQQAYGVSRRSVRSSKLT